MAPTTASEPSRGESALDVVASAVGVVAAVLAVLAPRRTTSTLVTPHTSQTDRGCHQTPPTAAVLLCCHPRRPRSTHLPNSTRTGANTILCGLEDEMPRGLS